MAYDNRQSLDFNSDFIVSRSPAELNKVIVIQRRYDLMEMLEKFDGHELEEDHDSLYLNIVRKRALTLWRELMGALYRKNNKNLEKVREVETKIRTGSRDVVVEESYNLLMLCDEIGLTRIDTGKAIDTTDWEEDNQAGGLS